MAPGRIGSCEGLSPVFGGGLGSFGPGYVERAYSNLRGRRFEPRGARNGSAGANAGIIGAFLYVLGCREPLPGLHERYVAARWRQTLGSTMHCVAGDGVGILAGAAPASSAAPGEPR